MSRQKNIQKDILLFFVFCCISSPLHAQKDSADTYDVSKMITLSEVVVRTGMDVPGFLQRVKNDSTFYKAFRTLHILGFTALNDVRMMNKDGTVKASLQSKTRQNVAHGCRTMDVLEETTT